MPRFSQGDIFEAATRAQLAVVFGHVGLNEMRYCWERFAAKHPQLGHVRDPFTELAGRAVGWSAEKWLWFVADQQNHGMTDPQLTAALDAALVWASREAVTSVATNGVADTDHGRDTADNRRSDDRRVALLADHAARAEVKYGLAIELISLNDAFVRSLR